MSLRPQRHRIRELAGGALVAVLAAGALTACTAGAGGGGSGDPDSLNVLMVNNPQMVDLQSLTDKYFTAETGIKVNYTTLPENDLRDKASTEFSSQADQYDLATLSNFEIPFYSELGWLAPLTDYADNDAEFDQDDILPSMTKSLSGADGQLYGEPFYGEASFLMYRKDVMDAAGITMPSNPTWQQVADIAAKVDGAQPGMKGICLRGQPGWGQILAPLTTVVNTFGGTWFDKDWNAQVTADPFEKAVQFYVDLVRAHGEAGAPQAGFTECLNNLQQGNVAMWYDATSAAGSLEADDSPVKGKIGYAQAPVVETDTSGWLYAWSWAMEAASKKKDAAWKFIAWASSKQYEETVGKELGWARVPAGKRASTYENPDYLEIAGAFAKPTQEAIENANPTDPGVQPRPTIGIQFVDIPDFTNFGTQASQYFSSAIAGQTSVEDALKKSQKAAQLAGDNYKSK